MAVKTSWAAGDVLTAADLTDTFAAKLATVSPPFVLTANTSLAQATHGAKTVIVNGAYTMTVPANATSAWAVGSFVNLKALASDVTVTFASGVGVHGPTGYVSNTSIILKANTSVTLVKYDTNDWVWLGGSATGRIVQVVHGSYATEVASTSLTYADTGLTASITPTSASNTVLVIVQQQGLAKDAGNTGITLRIMRGASVIRDVIGAALWTNNTNRNSGSLGVLYVDSPATTSSTTYKTQFALNVAAGTGWVQKDNSYSSITLMEISA